MLADPGFWLVQGLNSLQLSMLLFLLSVGLTVIFGVDNLLDKTYTSHASRLGVTQHPFFGELFLNDVEPGRNIKLTIAKTF